MAYTPTNWKSGDVVTSAKLNKLEQGVASSGGVLVVHVSVGGVLDKTYREIDAAGLSFIEMTNEGITGYLPLTEKGIDAGGKYALSYYDFSARVEINFAAESEDDYPAVQTNQ